MTPSESSSTRVSNRLIKNLVLTFLIGGVLVALTGIIVFSWGQQRFVADVKADSSLLGNMGSFLSGTVGVIWSLASVFLFYLALREQRKDIKINQDALNLQIKELEDTRMVYIYQSNNFKTQGFENTFFELLQLHSSTVKDLTYTSSWQHQQLSSNGKDVFIIWKQHLDYFSLGSPPSLEDDLGYQQESPPIPFTSFEDIKIAFSTRYIEIYNEYENALNHYFRQLYHIFKYVHLSPLITHDRRSFYTSLVRAQLSQNELYAIVYNSLVNGYGKPNFLFLIKKYNLAKNFNHSKLPSQLIWEYFKHEQEVVSDPFV